MINKQIQTIITLCAWCDSEMGKKTHEVEEVRQEIEDPLFSHGICPSCCDILKEELNEIVS